jgi:predicted RNase H-like nuclease (RuvC/YqgF family)
MSLYKAAILTASLALAGATAGAFPAQQQSSAPPPQPQSTASQAAPQQDSLAEAARKAREKAKTEPANMKSFTNDDISSIHANGVSTVGTAPAAPTDATAAKPGATAEPKKDEAYWRKRFADARLKISMAQKELEIMQKELNTLQTQFYSDPNKALQQQYSRDDINDKTAKIEAKKQEITQLQQALDDLTEELRRSGSPAGWGN